MRFVRQLTHDLRNDLNAIELQSAYTAELEQNDELKSEIKLLRKSSKAVIMPRPISCTHTMFQLALPISSANVTTDGLVSTLKY